MIGLIPASGKATRLGGIPKFALPCDQDNRSILYKHIKLMQPYCEKIIVSTTSQWENLVRMMDLDVEIMIIEPSTMNDALIKMSDKYFSMEYLIGMADTYFYGENPYQRLWASSKAFNLGFACWNVSEELKGRVGQVKIQQNEVIDIKDKVPNCDYKNMWGALMLGLPAIKRLNALSQHPGIDLQEMLGQDAYRNVAFEINGEYFDVGTLAGYKNLLNRLEL